jgi:MFS family permease
MTGLRPFLPILFVFLKGLDYTYLQIGTLFSVMSVSSLVLEIPAGSVADRFGPKITLIISSILLGLAFLLIGLVENYHLMLLIFTLWGSSKSFYSGSDSTLIIESLKHSNKLHKTSKYLSKKWACFYYGLAGGGLLTPVFLTYLDQKSTFIFSSVLYLLSIFVLLSIKSPPLDKSQKESVHHISNIPEYLLFLKDGVKYLLSHRTVKYLLIFTIVFSTCSMIFFQYLQIMLAEAGVQRINFGYFYAFFTFIAALSSQSSHLLDNFIGEKRAIYLVLTLTLVPLLTVKYLILFPLAFIPLISMQTQAGLFIPLMSTYLNRHIKSHNRATLNSMKSFSGGLSMSILSPIVGILADHFGFRIALMCLGLFVIIIAIGPALKISDRLSRVKPPLVS